MLDLCFEVNRITGPAQVLFRAIISYLEGKYAEYVEWLDLVTIGH